MVRVHRLEIKDLSTYIHLFVRSLVLSSLTATEGLSAEKTLISMSSAR